MSVSIIGNGPPSTWLMGQYRDEIYKVFSNQISQHPLLSQQKNIFVNTAWIIKEKEKQLLAAAKINSANNVFLFSLEDPFHNFWYTKNLKNNIREVGYTEKQNGITLDFWAMMCKKYFREYNENDLSLKEINLNAFLCYQFKPHVHRQLLAQNIIKNNLDKNGIVTLGKFDGHICKTEIMYKEILHLNNIYGSEAYTQSGNSDLSKTIDIFTLGDLDIWNKSFLNIVSETLPSESEHVFVTEKTFKPIIGLRPFIIFGTPKIYKWLQTAKFDIFEDLWFNNNLLEHTTTEDQIRKIINIITEFSRLQAKELLNIYNNIKPRLLENRKRFFNYAKEQENKLDNICNYI